MTYAELIAQFCAIYGGDASDLRVFEAPGRVNLIGEHTDYNGGYVFPAALTLSNVVVARKRTDKRIRLAVSSLPDRVDADIDQLHAYRDLPWGNYQIGTAWALQQEGYTIPGCDLLYHGTVPYGGGLSSSASIEVVTGYALAALADQPIDRVKLAIAARRAENEYVGVNCGIMDQFASALGKCDHAILLDCHTLEHTYVPLSLGDHAMLLIHTNKPHSLVESAYNERRAECERVLAHLQTRLPSLSALCHCTLEQLEANRDVIPSDVLYRRARHCVTENARTLQAVDCLQNGDLNGFGDLMCQSHISLRDDYEVTGTELDAIFDAARGLPGVLGVRMTGAGFGGCAIAIVDTSEINAVERELATRYEARIGYAPAFFRSGAGDGVREITKITH